MYAPLLTDSDSSYRGQALTISLLTTSLLLVVLALLRIHTQLPATDHSTVRLDTLELLTFVPIRLETATRPNTALARQTKKNTSPAPRFAPKPATALPSPAPVSGTQQPVIAQQQASPVETPKIDPASLYKKTQSRGNGQDPKARVATGGAPTGTAQGTYEGPSQGTGGIGLDLSGFRFGKMSVPQDPYDDTGRILFRIRVDAEGKILSLTVVQSTVSPTVTQWYKEQLARLPIVPIAKGERPEVSEGSITLKIVAR